jgi:hypothetical protein
MRSSTRSRPAGRLSYLVVAILVAAVGLRAADTPPTTTLIRDTVYRANGTPAGGTLVISWPAFETADHKTVAAGLLSVKLGEGGLLNVPLVPNEGATPVGTYYRVVTKLDEIRARFAKFSSMEECFAARDRMILTLPCYAEARACSAEPEKFVRALAKRWATDPEYAEKILRIALGLTPSPECAAPEGA